MVVYKMFPGYLMHLIAIDKRITIIVNYNIEGSIKVPDSQDYWDINQVPGTPS